MVLKLQCAQESTGVLVKRGLPGPQHQKGEDRAGVGLRNLQSHTAMPHDLIPRSGKHCYKLLSVHRKVIWHDVLQL